MAESKIRERKCQHCGEIVRYSYGETPQECPFCGSPYWNRPREEYKLFMIQDSYIASGYDKAKLSPMYEILVFYAENIIKRAIKGKVLFAPEVLNEKAQDIALNFFESYFKKEHYVVNSSFGGILSKIALGVLYNPRVKATDELLSLDFELDERRKVGDATTRYMEDGPEKDKLNEDVYEEFDRKNPEEALVPVMHIINEEKDHIREDFSLKDSLLFLVGVKLFLMRGQGSRNVLDDFYLYYGDSVKQDIDTTLSRIHESLAYTG